MLTKLTIALAAAATLAPPLLAQRPDCDPNAVGCFEVLVDLPILDEVPRSGYSRRDDWDSGLREVDIYRGLRMNFTPFTCTPIGGEETSPVRTAPTSSTSSPSPRPTTAGCLPTRWPSSTSSRRKAAPPAGAVQAHLTMAPHRDWDALAGLGLAALTANPRSRAARPTPIPAVGGNGLSYIPVGGDP